MHLPVVGEIGAGRAGLMALSPGTAVKIMTGAPVPDRLRRGRALRVDRPRRRPGADHPGAEAAPAHPRSPARTSRRVTSCSSTAPSSGRATSACSPPSAGPPCAAARARASSSSPPAPSCASRAHRWATTRSTTATPTSSPRPPARPAPSPTASASSPTTRAPSPTRSATSSVRADLVVTSGGVSQGDFDVVKEALVLARHGLVRRGRDAAGQAAGLRHRRRGRTPRSSRCPATRSRPTSPSRPSCCPPSAG